MPALLRIPCGALLLLWPALLNGYPLLFSDTGALMDMGFQLDMGWDKPWVYGPLVAATSLGLSLWLTVVAQALATSWALAMAEAALGERRPVIHFVLCAALALGTAAPWFTALLMPDLFAPLVAICLFVLAFGNGRITQAERWGIGLLGTIAIASHLAHLVVAAGCLLTITALRWRDAWRASVPLAAALAWLLLINLAGHGALSVSPYGSVFALARLVGDGPGRAYLDFACPDPAIRLCAWQGRLSADSDEFLWSPSGPIWADGYGPIRYAPEAARLVPRILAAYPLEILEAAARNTGRQLLRTTVSDVLEPDHLDVAVLPRLKAFLPPGEAAGYTAALQSRGLLGQAGAPFRLLHAGLLLAGTAATLFIALSRRTDPALRGLAVVALAAVLANAVVTGALSGPHDRYQARIAWLVMLPPFFAALRLYAARAARGARASTSPGLIRTRPL